MKNNKGFTLVELILIVAMLLIVVLMFSTNFEGIIGKQTEKSQERFINNINVATEAYISANPQLNNEIEYGKGYVKINVFQLIKNGFLDKKIVDPNTDKPIDRTALILVRLTCSGELDVVYPVKDEANNLSHVESVPLVVKTVPTDNYLEINTIGLRMLSEDGTITPLKATNTLEAAGDIKFIKANYNGTNPGTYKILYNYLDNTLTCRQHTRDVVIY